jgi:hypothetical protein
LAVVKQLTAPGSESIEIRMFRIAETQYLVSDVLGTAARFRDSADNLSWLAK